RGLALGPPRADPGALGGEPLGELLAGLPSGLVGELEEPQPRGRGEIGAPGGADEGLGRVAELARRWLEQRQRPVAVAPRKAGGGPPLGLGADVRRGELGLDLLGR